MNKPLLALSLTLLMLAGCQPVPTTPSPRPSATASPSQPAATPIPSSPAPTTSPSTQPSASPSAPDASPTPVTSATPAPSPTPSPSATPAGAPSLTVKVFDEDHSIVENASIEVRSLDEGVSFQKSVTAPGGSAEVQDLPANVNLEVIVSGPGYNQQRRLLLLGAGQHETMQFDDNLAISDRPEITSVDPGFPASVEVFDPIILNFSENMDHDSVEHSLAIQLDEDDDARFDAGALIPGAPSLAPRKENVIYDSGDLDLEWDSNRRLIVTPKHGWPVATSRNFRLVLNYRNADDEAGEILDDDGIESRRPSTGNDEDGPFRVGNQYRPFLPFQVVKDGYPSTKLRSVSADDNSSGDRLIVRFSREVRFKTASGVEVTGGSGGNAGAAVGDSDATSAAKAAQNYRLSCNGDDVELPDSAAAVFTRDDEVTLKVDEDDNLFEAGDNCELSLSTSVIDVFGKRINVSDENFTVN